MGCHGIGRFASELLRRLPAHPVLRRGPKPLSLLDPLWLSCQVASRRPRVFFSPGFNPPPATLSSVVFTIHDLAHLKAPGVATSAKRLYYKLIVQPAAHRAHRVLTVSEYSRGEILEWSGLSEERVVNVGNGVGPPFQPDGERYNPNYPYVLYVGNFRPHKNVPRLLAAFRELDHPELHLLLTGPPSPELKQQINRLGIRHRTRFLNTPNDNVLAAIYRGARLVVLPSLYEGFGLPALEAMACGVPVVASDRTALPEVVGDAAVLVNPLDVEAIHSAMEQVLTDPVLWDWLSAAGMARAAQFTWDAVATKVVAVLQSALNETA